MHTFLRFDKLRYGQFHGSYCFAEFIFPDFSLSDFQDKMNRFP